MLVKHHYSRPGNFTLNIAGGACSEDVDLRGKNAQVLLTGNVTLH